MLHGTTYKWYREKITWICKKYNKFYRKLKIVLKTCSYFDISGGIVEGCVFIGSTGSSYVRLFDIVSSIMAVMEYDRLK